jgi:hypothetical protein
MKDDDLSLTAYGANAGEPPAFDMGSEHWLEEIEFLEQRLRGEQGDIDKDDKEACEVALAIAKEKLTYCLMHQKLNFAFSVDL